MLGEVHRVTRRGEYRMLPSGRRMRKDNFGDVDGAQENLIVLILAHMPARQIYVDDSIPVRGTYACRRNW